jgi:hypothetical protein
VASTYSSMSMYSIVPHDHALNLLQMPEHVDERGDHREERDHRHDADREQRIGREKQKKIHQIHQTVSARARALGLLSSRVAKRTNSLLLDQRVLLGVRLRSSLLEIQVRLVIGMLGTLCSVEQTIDREQLHARMRDVSSLSRRRNVALLRNFYVIRNNSDVPLARAHCVSFVAQNANFLPAFCSPVIGISGRFDLLLACRDAVQDFAHFFVRDWGEWGLNRTIAHIAAVLARIKFFEQPARKLRIARRSLENDIGQHLLCRCARARGRKLSIFGFAVFTFTARNPRMKRGCADSSQSARGRDGRGLFQSRANLFRQRRSEK